MALVKFKIDEKWDGLVLNNTVAYEPGDIFEADESLGKNRPWLIKQPKAAKISEKAENEKTPKDMTTKELNIKAAEEAAKKLSDKKKEEGEKKKEEKDAK